MQAIGWGHAARSRASTDANIDSSPWIINVGKILCGHRGSFALTHCSRLHHVNAQGINVLAPDRQAEELMQAIGWGHEARSRASTDANIDSLSLTLFLSLSPSLSLSLSLSHTHTHRCSRSR
jgi:hypothetical protein